jgi:hypothetical protein
MNLQTQEKKAKKQLGNTKMEILRLTRLSLNKSSPTLQVTKTRVFNGSPLNSAANSQAFHSMKVITKIGRRTDYLLYNKQVKLKLCKCIIELRRGGIKF